MRTGSRPASAVSTTSTSAARGKERSSPSCISRRRWRRARSRSSGEGSVRGPGPLPRSAAVEEERLSRRKNDAAFPLSAIEWCLDHAGLSPEDLDAVVFYEKPMLKFERIVTMALRGFPRTWRSFPRAMQSALGGKLWVKGIIASQLGVSGDRILFTDHH